MGLMGQMKPYKRRIRPSEVRETLTIKSRGLGSGTWALPPDGIKQHDKIMHSRKQINKLPEVGRKSPAVEPPDARKKNPSYNSDRLLRRPAQSTNKPDHALRGTVNQYALPFKLLDMWQVCYTATENECNL